MTQCIRTRCDQKRTKSKTERDGRQRGSHYQMYALQFAENNGHIEKYFRQWLKSAIENILRLAYESTILPHTII